MLKMSLNINVWKDFVYIKYTENKSIYNMHYYEKHHLQN